MTRNVAEQNHYVESSLENHARHSATTQFDGDQTESCAGSEMSAGTDPLAPLPRADRKRKKDKADRGLPDDKLIRQA